MAARKQTAVLLPLVVAACGGGVPLEVRIDEFTFELGLDQTLAVLAAELAAVGLLPAAGPGLPELWPDALPDIEHDLPMTTDPVAVDLTPDPSAPDHDKYQQINDRSQIVRRIEINELVLRIDASTLSIPIPDMAVQLADAQDANPDDRQAWFTIGRMPGAPAGFVGDLPFTWERGGETYFDTQLQDDVKEFAMRGTSSVHVKTADEPRLPHGKALLRLIVVATFFVEPTKANAAF